jgi:YfiH family protein
MFKNYNDGIKLFHFDNFAKSADVFHFVATREGGHSRAPYDTMNLALTVGDDPEAVKNNRTLLASILGISVENIAICKQVHGDDVVVINQNVIDMKVSTHISTIATADAMITNIPGICIMILIADCVPILLYDTKRKAIGVTHAGWRGTARQIVKKSVDKMVNAYSCEPENIIAGIGPSIGPCCYEVGLEVITEFEKSLNNTKDIIADKKNNGKGNLDLWRANKKQLMQAGIPEDNIDIAELCTYCHHDIFYSYRHQGEISGRFAAGIMLKGHSSIDVNVGKD